MSRLPWTGNTRFASTAAIGLFMVCATDAVAQTKRVETLQELGGAFFADRNLSFSRKQNCMSCHSPELAFTDPREHGEVQSAVSRGGDGHSLGDRNAPTLAYAARIPRFHFTPSGLPEGGMFHDGRAAGLEEQAVAPLTNPTEMGIPDRVSVVARVAQNPSYVDAFSRMFGAGTLDDTDKAYWALGLSIAAVERTREFVAFDSRYDRSLRGETELSEQEKAGYIDARPQTRTKKPSCDPPPDHTLGSSFTVSAASAPRFLIVNRRKPIQCFGRKTVGI